MPQPYSSLKDIFCLRETRRVNAHRRIALCNQTVDVPNVLLYKDVNIHLIPDICKQIMELRIWWADKLVRSLTMPLHAFTVHF